MGGAPWVWQGMRCLDTGAGSRAAKVTATGWVAMWQGLGHSQPQRQPTRLMRSVRQSLSAAQHRRAYSMRPRAGTEDGGGTPGVDAT
jgi:hypothetical protein